MVKANARALSKNRLERWIKCAGRESRLFPNILENMAALCLNERIKQVLVDNLDDERGNGDLGVRIPSSICSCLMNLAFTAKISTTMRSGGSRFACELAQNISLQSNLAIAMGYMLINGKGIP